MRVPIKWDILYHRLWSSSTPVDLVLTKGLLVIPLIFLFPKGLLMNARWWRVAAFMALWEMAGLIIAVLKLYQLICP